MKILRNPLILVALNSFLILYLELALIRYLPGYIYYLGYFANFVLIATFLGMGMGILLAKVRFSLILCTPFLLILLLGLTRFFSFGIDATTKDIVYLQYVQTRGDIILPAYVLLPMLFTIVASIFTCLAQPLGRFFHDAKRPLAMYVFDIVGSLIGIMAFYSGVFLSFPPLAWFGLFFFLFISFMLLLGTGRQIFLIILISIGAVILSSEFGNNNVYWSPYYKITLAGGPGSVINLYANSIGHQFFSKLEDAPFYSYIYTGLSKTGQPPDEILIIGAGTGQDVNAALSIGAKHIDAVEIDPVILQIGKEKHPEKPYDNPRVTAYTDDGRNFLRNTNKQYDFIVFALTDSLIANSRLGQVRLESYLFTMEAFSLVRKRLKPGGYFVLYNDYREGWLVDRLDSMIQTTFGTDPGELKSPETTVLFLAKHNPSVPKKSVSEVLPTDDWPFFYRQARAFSGFHVPILGSILAITVVAVMFGLRISSRLSKVLPWRLSLFFLLGAAFALIEAKSIAQLTLLFGSTWIVNIFAFCGILISVLIACLFTLRFPFTRQNILFALLVGSLLLQYVFPPSNLATLGFFPRLSFAVLYFYAPIFFANLIFAKLFYKSKLPQLDLGSNIIGLVFGALIEYIAIVTGFSFLSILALVFYALAFLSLKMVKAL